MLRTLIVAVLIAVVPIANTFACMMPAKFSFRIFIQSNTVLNVRIVGYEKVTFNPFYGTARPGAIGLFEFEAVEREEAPSAKEHGANMLYPTGVRGRFKAYWLNSTFVIPAEWKGPTDMIVALTVKSLPNGIPAVFIAQDDCTRPALVEDTVENMLHIAGVQAETLYLFREPSND